MREPLRVDAGFNADDWVHNLTRLRAEKRLTLAATRPTPFVTVTGMGTGD